jgi:DNA helicase-2/ATP-dependent DNA helicase PcrA
MPSFKDRYKILNEFQRTAVDQTDGPLLVLAGPGTGKTELLGMRVANILDQTDELAENILCLTFSEAGARTMRERLTDIMGQDAYKVGIFTFHGFGTDVINHYPEYFYGGADVEPADELAQHKLFEDVLSEAPAKNYFSKRFDGEFTMLGMAHNIVSDIKRAGLMPEELYKICDQNLDFINFAEPLFNELLNSTITKASLEACIKLASKLADYKTPKDSSLGLPMLSEVCLQQLNEAIAEAQVHPRTTPPITAFKNNWRSPKWRDKFVMKSREQTENFRDAGKIYELYQQALNHNRLIDYDDMIVQVVHQLEKNSELRSSLQEQYHYIMVDEYQDTNLAQYRILRALTNHPLNEGRPNIMVVGDDDQGIYAFQGADINNVNDFIDSYQTLGKVVLTTNYRSSQPILDLSRSVITQSTDRLENKMPELIKELVANDQKSPSKIARHSFETTLAEQTWIANEIKRLMKAGTLPNQIAIISAKHLQLQSLIPHLHSEGIAVTYEKSENVLEEEHIMTLLRLAEVIVLIEAGRLEDANGLLPRLLSHPMWQLSSRTIWQTSLDAYHTKPRRLWLEVMLQSDDPQLKAIAEWLIDCSQKVEQEPLELFLDLLIGIEKDGEKFISPFHDYYFSQTNFQTKTVEYIDLMEQLATLREALRKYEPRQRLFIADLLEFSKRCLATKTKITNTRTETESTQSVQLMTAHGAKGLEFEVVFIIDSNQDNWVKFGGRSDLSYPPNMVQLKHGGHELSDRLRLFYVALTRAKHQLYLTRAIHDYKNKELLPLSFLKTETADQLAPVDSSNASIEPKNKLAALEADWRDIHHVNIGRNAAILRPILDNFYLSATALDNFLDIEYGGPQAFLEQSLLKFPTATSPNAAFGSAVHKTLYAAHMSVIMDEPKTIKDLLKIFSQSLKESSLAIVDENYWLQKGEEYLSRYLKINYKEFTAKQLVERSFDAQGCMVGQARLTGRLDLLETINDNEMVVTDYKTGSPESRWSLNDIGSRANLYKYRRQLIFYKLLVECSKDYGRTYKVNEAVIDFIQPTKDTNELLKLTYKVENDEVERVRLLIEKVWQLAMNLNFPDISSYPKTLTGIKNFEQDLLDDKFN